MNYQNYKMKIVEYNSANDISVQFQDNYCVVVKSAYREFKNGKVKNPYYPEVYDIGIIGQKYHAYLNSKEVLEYKIWHSILQRCFVTKIKDRQPTYKDVTCCDDWLIYENFYEWVHKQGNYKKWATGHRWALDKDIILKGNKSYYSDYCCLVPPNINSLFTKRQNYRGDYPIGVYYYKAGNSFRAQCMNPYTNKRELIGTFSNQIDAFEAYKTYKEKLVKSIAEDEYKRGNIIEKCYDAMVHYIVEITD